jgi:hypothetical protein
LRAAILAALTAACSHDWTVPVRVEGGAPDVIVRETDAGTEGGGGCTGGRDAGFVCGAATCTAPTEVCCLHPAGPGCVVAGTCGVLQRNCASASDCPPGDRCCQFGEGGEAYRAAVCKPSCGSLRTLCAKDDQCETGQRCGPPVNLIDYWHCQSCP